MKIVIIGAGIAAVSAALEIRKNLETANITIVTAEKYLPYRRPALTRMIYQDLSDEQFLLHSADFYQKNNIEVLTKKTAVKLSPKEKTILTTDNDSISYDKLLLATGSNCSIPPLRGVNLPGVFSLRSYDDLLSIKKLISKNRIKRATVVGGGLLGLELADFLTKKHLFVDIFEACSDILPKQLDAQGAKFFEKSITKNSNIKTHYGTLVSSIKGDNKVTAILTENGTLIDTDMVIFAAGVCPNISLAKNAGLQIARGVQVNEKLQTSDANIYAAGDCATVVGFSCGGLWSIAQEQGRVAGANIAGIQCNFEKKLYGARLMAFGTRLFSIGDIGNNGANNYTEIMHADDQKLCYRKIFFNKDEGQICGGILLGDIAKARLLQQAIEDKLSFRQCKTIGLIDDTNTPNCG